MGFISYIDGKYSYIKRYNQIMHVLFMYGFEDLVSYMEEKKTFKWFNKLIPKSTYEHAMNLSKWEKMRMVCETLGPTFVKFGQLMSNRPDILPADLIKELEKLQDSVPPLSGKIASQVIEQELKKKPEELFAWFEPEAFASASMAQVHRATLKTGEKVVLKIQRPEIKHTIEQDIKVMLYVAEIFNRRIPSLKSFDPIGLIKNFEISIMNELDFIHESINVQRFHNNFKEDETDKGYIHSPKVYRELTTSKVLTLEYIDGIKISDLQNLHNNGLDRKLVAKRLAVSYFKQVFNYGFFHADPHPGNLFVLPNNVICYIDYGMMGSIMTNDIEQFGNLFLAVRSKDVKGIIHSIQQLSDNPIVRNFRELETDINEFIQNYATQSENENELSTVLLELKDIIVKHGLKVPTHFFLIARSMVTVEGVIHQLDPDLDLTKMASPYFIRIVAKHYNPVKFVKRVLNSVYEMGMYMEDFPRDLKNAILKINTGEIKVDLRHQGIDPLVHTFNRISRQIISAVIMASLIIGSSLMVVYHITPLWGNTSLYGILGFIVSGLIALSMMKDLSRGDHDDWAGWEN